MSSDDFVGLGVSVSLIDQFETSLKAHKTTISTTTACESYVLPATKQELCSYVDLYKDAKDDDGRPLIAPATVFVSHAWQRPVSESLEVMQAFQKNSSTHQVEDLT